MKITFSLDTREIEKAVKQMARYANEIDKKTALICEKLAEIGLKEASVRFASASYDGNNDVDVSIKPIENGWAIVAKGEAVAFIEFGAGVYHNPTEPYPLPRPEGVSNIGEYGKGFGKRKAWGYYDDKGKLVITRGNPAAMPMWFATKEMEREITRIAKEVFK